MTGERPIAGAGAEPPRARPSRSIARGPLCGTLLGLALLPLLLPASTRPALAQGAARDAVSPTFEAGSPLAKRDANSRFGLDTGDNGLPALRRGERGNGLGGAAGGGAGAGEDDGLGSGSAGGLGGGARVSRLPRFQTSIVPTSGLSGAPGTQSPSQLRQRAAPPRRFGVPTRTPTRTRTQGFTTDLRLTPVIQTAVSGVPLAAVPLPTPIPLLGLNSPSRFLLATGGIGRGPNEADPAYAPLGVKLGTFTLFPAFTQSVGYDTNPDQTTRNLARGSLVSRSEGELLFNSDWSSSSFSGEMRGGYSAFPDNEGANRPNAAGVTRLRVDVNRDTRLDVETRLLVDTQRTGSPDVNAQARERPIFATYGTSAGVTETFNRLQLSLRGSIDRQVFQDAQLENGTTLIQSDRDANQYGMRLRAAYEISPTITPFAETTLDTRVYDTPVDTTGYRRDSDGVGFAAGAAVSLSRFLSAEVSAGLQHREYVDRRLRAITAPILNAALIWQVSPLTTVRFNQTTGVIETSVPGASGVFIDIATLEVQHELLRNLSITVGGSVLSNDYQGGIGAINGGSIRERGYSALARLDYRFNRWLTFRGSYIRQQLSSNALGSSFHEDAFLLGVRVNP